MTAPSLAAGATSAEIVHGQREYLLPSMLHMYSEPLSLVEGKGVRVKDAEGREYLDLFAGILTTSVGHCNPRVNDAVNTQMNRLGHVSTLYSTGMQVEAAKRIAEISPGELRRTFFSNSGTEAIETALMMACLATGRNEIIGLRVGYHGRSFMATSVTAHSGWRPLSTPIAGIKHAKSPNAYRCPYKQPCDDTCVDKFVDDLEEVIVTSTNGRPAAFIAETIQGVAGYVVPPPTYFEKAAEVIHSYGGLLIIDEVQAGFGRCGKHWFGIDHWGVEPDIMVMAKGIANGAPVGATVTTDEIAHAWKGKTISTFGGNPVSMAALCATQDELKACDAPANAEARGAELRAGLEAIQGRHPWVGDVRGMGLMQAMEIVKDPMTKEPDNDRTAAFLQATRDEGLLIGVGGLNGTVVRIGPALNISSEDIAEGLAKLGRAADKVG
ncbi:MAG: aspartate aminotransferase family protein [Gemmatimonadales bacterium]|jgi:4-aminobutyrate aminotransferase-like enzyme|nr:aspartate aminotransferase family protein [Gemmatimonadales bacterium]MDG2241642.1 aspartate aminotransferase family protein [Longimicrobiales bacterium]MBT3775462.1 aspartate aminotransferase family protein [Gemmatimonadales bacterium]MBT3958609.1 aspartate aminotransferase family protein [Gemmatimonadales bacterium]MBT4188221.1 aspartate aminotransferase family protein [Gemmatimonadales bacterium]